MAGIGKLSAVANQFTGVGIVAIVDPTVAASINYATAGLKELTPFKKFGSILSMESTGDEASLEQWLDINGVAVTAATKAGTYKYDLVLMDVTPEYVKTLFRGSEITIAQGEVPDWVTSSNEFTVYGYGDKIPVIETPFLFFNETNNQWMLMPKAKIVASFGSDSNNQTIKLSVLAQIVDTAKLKPIMYATGTPAKMEG